MPIVNRNVINLNVVEADREDGGDQKVQQIFKRQYSFFHNIRVNG